VNQTLEASVFPIEGVVFFPSLTLPLNIFEPRYILMVNDCIDSGRPLAVTDLDPVAGAIVGMGSVQLFEKRADGTMVILVRGTHRGRITRVLQEKPYFRAELEPLEESSLVDPSHRFFLQRLRSGMEEWAGQTLPDAASRQAFLSGLDDLRHLVETYAHFKILDADIRQELLEAASLDSRVELLRRVI
jgi:Lon protease-like protein